MIVSIRRMCMLMCAALVLAPVVATTGSTQDPASAIGASADECPQTHSGVTVSVAREARNCVVAITSGSGSWTVPEGVTELRYAVVGGGGGGGITGGGGAGAFFETSDRVSVTAGAVNPVSIGAGGAGSPTRTDAAAGSNGGDTTFDTVTAYGGGGGSSMEGQFAGAAVRTASGYGGSGGGAMAVPRGIAVQSGDQEGTSRDKQDVAAGQPAGTTGGAGLARNAGGATNSVYVFLGAPSDFTLAFYIGGGGGGAGAVGGDSRWSPYTVGDTQTIDFNPGAGGAGTASTLLTAATAAVLDVGEGSSGAAYFAGGGAGGANYHSIGWTLPPAGQRPLIGAPGLGGGGGGSPRTTALSLPNSGGGGRGATGFGIGQAGAAGVVIISYSVSHAVSFPTLDDVTLGAEPITLQATSDRGLVVSYASQTPSTCTVEVDRVTIVAAGTCTITAGQSGSDDYPPAESRTRSFSIGPRAQAALVIDSPSTMRVDESLPLSGLGGSGSGAITFTVVSGDCTISSGVLTASTPGTCVLTATRAGDNDHLPVTSPEFTLIVLDVADTAGGGGGASGLAFTGVAIGADIFLALSGLLMLTGIVLLTFSIAYRRRLLAPNRALLRWQRSHPSASIPIYRR